MKIKGENMKTISEFAKHKLPYPMSEWAKGLLEIKKSDGKVSFYMDRRRTNFFYYYLQKLKRDKGNNN